METEGKLSILRYGRARFYVNLSIWKCDKALDFKESHRNPRAKLIHFVFFYLFIYFIMFANTFDHLTILLLLLYNKTIT